MPGNDKLRHLRHLARGKAPSRCEAMATTTEIRGAFEIKPVDHYARLLAIEFLIESNIDPRKFQQIPKLPGYFYDHVMAKRPCSPASQGSSQACPPSLCPSPGFRGFRGVSPPSRYRHCRHCLYSPSRRVPSALAGPPLNCPGPPSPHSVRYTRVPDTCTRFRQSSTPTASAGWLSSPMATCRRACNWPLTATGASKRPL